MLATVWTAGPMLEAGMLICFGVSWPVDIWKTLRTRRTEGKSLAFMALVFGGYMLGLGAKVARAAEGDGVLERIAALYVFNAVLIAVDMFVTWRLRSRPAIEPAA